MEPEIWAEIKRLRQVEKLSISEIARRVRMDRKTIRSVLKSESMLIRKRSIHRPSKLESFKNYIAHRIKEYPNLTSSVLFEEIKKQGYTGKIRILAKYLSTIRAKAREVFLRIETQPGEQMQMDWANCGTITIGQGMRKLSLFVSVLSFSRLMYMEFTLSQRLEDFIQCHINAFNYFSGICKKILYDNLKLVVLSRVGTDIRFNPKFLEFSGIFGFEPVLCNVARANEKGKVENNIKYIRGNFLSGRKITSWQELQEQSRRWLDEVANVRVHRTTSEKPLERWEREKVFLQPLPCRDYDVSIPRAVRSNHQALVSFDGNMYSVPPQWAYKTLLIKANSNDIRILANDNEEIARHKRSYDRGAVIEDPKHLEGILALKRKALAARIEKGFLNLGEVAKIYHEGLVANQVHLGKHITRIMELVNCYGQKEVLEAMGEAMKFKAFGAAYVQNILIQKRTNKGLKEILPITIPQKPEWNEIITQEPDLSTYDKIVDNDNQMEDENNAQTK